MHGGKQWYEIITMFYLKELLLKEYPAQRLHNTLCKERVPNVLGQGSRST